MKWFCIELGGICDEWERAVKRAEQAEADLAQARAELAERTVERDEARHALDVWGHRAETAEADLAAARAEVQDIEQALREGGITTVGASFEGNADAVRQTIAALRHTERDLAQARADLAAARALADGELGSLAYEVAQVRAHNAELVAALHEIADAAEVFCFKATSQTVHGVVLQGEGKQRQFLALGEQVLAARKALATDAAQQALARRERLERIEQAGLDLVKDKRVTVFVVGGRDYVQVSYLLFAALRNALAAPQEGE